MQNTTPNLFILGVMKSGTSTLHHLLSEHPQIFMSAVKEPCFFADTSANTVFPCQGGQDIAGNLDRYLALFTNATSEHKYRGESSTWYAQFPHHPNAIPQIKKFSPDARVVLILRDPLTRLLSHLKMAAVRRELPENLSLAFRRQSIYMSCSNYQSQLERVAQFFDRKQIHVLTFESLVANPELTLRKTFHWLGVDENNLPPSIGIALNTAEERALHQSILWQKWISSQIHKRGKTFVPRSWRQAIKRWLANKAAELTYNELEEELIQATNRKLDFLSAQKSFVQQWLQRPIPEWTTRTKPLDPRKGRMEFFGDIWNSEEGSSG